ncbi:tumor necrosis factor receptor superfamily member 14-like isoform X2 [Alosa pseudoharengus]|uniref:tumor necrosis factor receptor superfamily member 14-like isoform X2 n=1 Tax=Alosa pseudoharengus TaxID=34774 RepID=UPI003F8967BA
MKRLQFILILLMTVDLCDLVFSVCGRAEYLIGKECCPMCSPGYYVHVHCAEYRSTTCVSCAQSTFTDEPNGLTSCRSCSICDQTAGLRVKRACSSTSDTLCEPLEGHYCTDPIKDGCRGAVEHTTCSPGQYIKQKGNASSDAVCGECVGATYSNGSFTSCRSHTRCESLGSVLKKPGTHTADAECDFRRHHMQVPSALPQSFQTTHPIEPGAWILVDLRRKHRNQERLRGPHEVIRSTPTAVRIAEGDTWVHLSHCSTLPGAD